MIRCTLKQPSDYKVQQWKNGLGQTTEIAVDPSDPYRWRLSVATLGASGPFSNYPEYDRNIVLLHGGPIILLHGTGKSRHLHSLTSYKFKGEWNTTAEVASPGEDFNLFTLRDFAKGNTYPNFIKAGEETQFPIAGHEHFIYCVEGSAAIHDRNTSQNFKLTGRDLLQISRVPPKEYLNLKAIGISARTTLLWVVVHIEAHAC